LHLRLLQRDFNRDRKPEAGVSHRTPAASQTMPDQPHDPATTVRADNTRETPLPASDEVALGEAPDKQTLDQHGPPSWVQQSEASHESNSGEGSTQSASGKAIHELEREIERSRIGGDGEYAEGYKLVRKLGTGSFGAVWEAEDQHSHERVAIKFFTAGHADWEKLLTEVGVLQSVEGCRGIVMVKQVRPAEPGRRPYYAMQLANGGSLADWLKNVAQKLSPRDRVKVVVRFFTQIARAMAAVHRRGIHHCDLKPQNILLHHPEPDRAPDPLVADFGQAHLATDDTPALGTFFYMPPDQIDSLNAGTPPDTRWDVYALGAIAYEMLTGEAPRRSAELSEKIKKAPKHLATKLAIYQQGIIAAPRPVAHLPLVDRALARIIDRCLSLNPDTRPRDAGALVALLDSRARWLRTRPVLALAAAATLLVVGLIGSGGIALANLETRNQETYVTDEVKSCLTRTAGYGARAVEDRLQRHIVSLETWAAQPHDGKHPKVREAILTASAQLRQPTLDSPLMKPDDANAVHEWLKELQGGRRRRAGNAHVPTLGVMLVTPSETPSRERGFYVARIHENGNIETRDNSAETAFFSSDLSYRDYFNATGERESEKHLPHAVIRATHISQPFRSRGVDLHKTEKVQQPWKLNIAAPIWDDPATRTRVIGLLILGLDIERDIESLVHPPEFDDDSEKRPIAKEVKVVLVDHRNRWVWHPDCKKGVLAKQSSENSQDRLPHDYLELATKRNLNPTLVCPWTSFPAKRDATANRQTYTTSHEYVDLVQSRIYSNDRPEIACFTRFNPYRLSEYEKQHTEPRDWVFVAQVDKQLALAPLRKLEQRLVTIGMGAGAVMLLLAVALWVWLFRVLRRLEFASHG
jgi:hypothetical protein